MTHYIGNTFNRATNWWYKSKEAPLPTNEVIFINDTYPIKKPVKEEEFLAKLQKAFQQLEQAKNNPLPPPAPVKLATIKEDDILTKLEKATDRLQQALPPPALQNPREKVLATFLDQEEDSLKQEDKTLLFLGLERAPTVYPDQTKTATYAAEEFKRLLLQGEQMPWFVTVIGDLALSDAVNWKNFPLRLHVEGDLDLSCCSFASLPQGLSVAGSLDLTGCLNLTSIYPGLYIGKDLIIDSCPQLTYLPGGMRVGRDLVLGFQSHLETLPDYLYVGGSLDLTGWEGTKLPRHLHVEGDLILPFSNLKSVGDLYVGGTLDFRRSTKLEYIEGDIHVGKDLILSGSESLWSIHAQTVYVGGTLDLSSLALITFIGKLRVKGELILKDCEFLMELPLMHVGGSIDLSGCSSLEQLPRQIYFGAHLNLEGCTSLTSAPNWLKYLTLPMNGLTRYINLTNTGLPKETLETFRTIEASHILFLNPDWE